MRFFLLSILLTWSIQVSRLILRNENVSETPNICINSSVCRFLQFLFILIPQNFLLITYLPKFASRLAISLFIVQDFAPYFATGTRLISTIIFEPSCYLLISNKYRLNDLNCFWTHVLEGIGRNSCKIKKITYVSFYLIVVLKFHYTCVVGASHSFDHEESSGKWIHIVRHIFCDVRKNFLQTSSCIMSRISPYEYILSRSYLLCLPILFATLFLG